MEYKIFIVLVIIILAYIYLLKNSFSNQLDLEHMSNDEAIQNVAGLYNAKEMKITSIQTTGNIKSGNNLDVKNNLDVGNIANIKHGYFSGGKGSTVDPTWGTHFPFQDNGQKGENFIRGTTNHDGDFRINGKLCVGGFCLTPGEFIEMAQNSRRRGIF
jgi:hypothetical protein